MTAREGHYALPEAAADEIQRELLFFGRGDEFPVTRRWLGFTQARKLERLSREAYQDALRRSVSDMLKAGSFTVTPLNPLQELCGIYFLRVAEAIVYVGQSTNIAARLSNHHAGAFDDALIFRCSRDELDDWEGFFIRLLRPARNGGVLAQKKNLSAPQSMLWSRVEKWGRAEGEDR